MQVHHIMYLLAAISVRLTKPKRYSVVLKASICTIHQNIDCRITIQQMMIGSDFAWQQISLGQMMLILSIRKSLWVANRAETYLRFIIKVISKNVFHVCRHQALMKLTRNFIITTSLLDKSPLLSHLNYVSVATVSNLFTHLFPIKMTIY